MIRNCLSINQHKCCVVNRLMSSVSPSIATTSSLLYLSSSYSSSPSISLSTLSYERQYNKSIINSSIKQYSSIGSGSTAFVEGNENVNNTRVTDEDNNIENESTTNSSSTTTTSSSSSTVPFQKDSSRFKIKVDSKDVIMQYQNKISGTTNTTTATSNNNNIQHEGADSTGEYNELEVDDLLSSNIQVLYKSLQQLLTNKDGEYAIVQSSVIVDKIIKIVLNTPGRAQEFDKIITLLIEFYAKEDKMYMLSMVTNLCSKCNIAPEEQAYDIIYRYTKEKNFEPANQIDSPVFIQSILERSFRDNQTEWLNQWTTPSARSLAIPLVYNQVTNRKDIYDALMMVYKRLEDPFYVQRVMEVIIRNYMLIDNAQSKALEWYRRIIIDHRNIPNLNTLLHLMQDDSTETYWDKIKSDYVIGSPILRRELGPRGDLLEKILSNYIFIDSYADTQLQQCIEDFNQERLVNILVEEYFSKNLMPSGNLLINAAMTLYRRRPNYYLYEFVKLVPFEYGPLIAAPWIYCDLIKRDINEAVLLMLSNKVDQMLTLESESIWNSLVRGLIVNSQWDLVGKMVSKMVEQRIRIHSNLVRDLSSCMMNLKRVNRIIVEALSLYQSRMEHISYPHIQNIKMLCYTMNRQFSLAKTVYDNIPSNLKNLITYRLATILYLEVNLQNYNNNINNNNNDNNNNSSNNVSLNNFESFIYIPLGFKITDLRKLGEIIVSLATANTNQSLIGDLLLSQYIEREASLSTPFFLKLQENNSFNTANSVKELKRIIKEKDYRGCFQEDSEFMSILKLQRATIKDHTQDQPIELTKTTHIFLKYFLHHDYARAIRIKNK